MPDVITDPVYAFTPRSIDYPHFVAEDLGSLRDLVGGFVGAEQCDGCGNSTYRVERLGTLDSFVARCAVDSTDDPEFIHPAPCGTTYPILSYTADKVVF